MNKDKLALRVKVIFYFLLGVALPISTAFALDQIEAKNVSFNPKNGLASTNMEDAIDEVYQKILNIQNKPMELILKKSILEKMKQLLQKFYQIMKM